MSSLSDKLFELNDMLGDKMSVMNRMLDKYDYPERPCDTKCIDGCLARADCGLFRAWEVRTKADARLEESNQKMRAAGFETIEETAAREARGLLEFEKWWIKLELQIDPETYDGDENEIRKAAARCTWGECLKWMLVVIENKLNEIRRTIKEELGVRQGIKSENIYPIDELKESVGGAYRETLESAGCTGGCPTYSGAPKTPDGSPDCSKCPQMLDKDFEGGNDE